MQVFAPSVIDSAAFIFHNLNHRQRMNSCCVFLKAALHVNAHQATKVNVEHFIVILRGRRTDIFEFTENAR
jgi:hypothetical protein